MATQLVLAATLTRRMWFETDSWHYLTERGTVPGHSVGWFEPWGGHWQTVPVLLYRALFAIFGMHTYTPYVLTATLIPPHDLRPPLRRAGRLGCEPLGGPGGRVAAPVLRRGVGGLLL